VGPPQPEFLNAVCEVTTSLSARDLFLSIKGTEKVVGRKPGSRWGPRLIDLDLLLYADQAIDEPDLTVPHPEMLNRAFVLIPLFEVAPDAVLPSGQKVSENVAPGSGGVRLYEKGWLKEL
jgi:2-amino-4-hydroxy-6-hydroxymethyldihydropteridine diphosphokinase